MEKINKENLEVKVENGGMEMFLEMKEAFLNYANEQGFREKVSGEMFMRVNRIEEIYYFILMNNPMELGINALQAIYDCNLYKRYKFCGEDINTMRWIESLSEEEYYFIASQILEKQPNLIDVQIEFKGFGYYSLVIVPHKNNYRIYVKEIEEIKKLHKQGVI